MEGCIQEEALTIYFFYLRSTAKLADCKNVRSAGCVRSEYHFVSVNGMSGDIFKVPVFFKVSLSFPLF